MELRQRWKRMASVVILLYIHAGLLLAEFAGAKQGVSQSCPQSDPIMYPTHETFQGLDVIWQIPPRPKGVLILLHGGQKDPFSFFDRGPKCTLCYGLPEDRTAVLWALKDEYAVLAPKSSTPAWHTWPLDADDLDFAVTLVQTWTRKHGLEDLPLVGWGHSSGGFFLTSLTFRLSLQAIVLMCCEGDLNALKLASPSQFPPTFFVYMLSDDDNLTTTAKVEKGMAVLRERGVKIKQRVVLHQPLTPTFLSERIRCMPEEISRKVYEAFKMDGTWLDSEDFLSKKNLAHSDWTPVVVKSNALPYCEEFQSLFLEAHVRQELGVAQAYHCFTKEANGEIMKWLNSHALPSLSASS